MSDEDVEPLVALEHVGITHLDADEPTIRDVSFAIRPGEVVLLLGPSGAGKSTLALALNGLVPHTLDAEVTGTVRVGGVDAATSSPAVLSTRVGMVFQDPDAQVVTGTVRDEVAFALENRCLPAIEIERRLEHALKRMGLWERRDDDPAELSGGGRQRLALAAALATDAPLLVLDEPTANLDPDGVRDVYGALHELVSAGDRALLLIEHDIGAALPLATRVVALDHEGRLAFDGAPTEISGTRERALRDLGVWPRDAGEGVSRPRPLLARDAVVELRGLTIGRGRRGARRTVLDHVSLAVPRGSFTAIVGPNGAGKTTLAQAMAGVIPAPRGSVSVDGADPARTRPARRAAHVGFVFQNPEHQFVAHTVRDELAHELVRTGLSRDEMDRRVERMLDRLGLSAHAHRHPFRLSGGQKRRLSVGTALIGLDEDAGGVLVLDEPLFGQDRARADELVAMLDRLNAAGVTIVVVTHDRDLVARCATHVIEVAAGGAVLHEAPPHPGPVPVADGGPAEERPVPPALDGSEAVPLPETGPVPVAEPPAPDRRRALDRRDPLAKLIAVLPAMIALVFTRDVLTPALVLGLSYAVLLVGSRLTPRLAIWLGATMPAIVLVLSGCFALWTDPSTGLATGLRLGALLATALVAGVSSDGAGVVRSLTQHLRLPYRLGYTALAGLRFVPRFRYEREVIRSAHRVRGHGGSGPIAALRLGVGTLVPLLASGIRHAERVALAMDARAFGAHPTRTERHPAVWTHADTALVAIAWAVTAAVFLGTALARLA